MNEGKNIRIGRKVVGFMCCRTEPYPFGESECFPMYGDVERLPDEPVIQKKSLQERLAEAVARLEQEHKE